MCASLTAHKTGTFHTDPSFVFDGTTSASAELDEYAPADIRGTFTGLTLHLHQADEHGSDPTQGAYLDQTSFKLVIGVGTKWPSLPVGTYDDVPVDITRERSLCYASGLGATGEDVGSTTSFHAMLTITRSDTRLAGSIELPAGGAQQGVQGGAPMLGELQRLDFDAPVTVGSDPKVGALCCLGGDAATARNAGPKCAVTTTTPGTFKADPYYAIGTTAKPTAYFDLYRADGTLGVNLRLVFGVTDSGSDAFGGYTRTANRELSLSRKDARPWLPNIPPGVYDVWINTNNDTSVCYQDGLGYLDQPVVWREGLPPTGKLTIIAQSATSVDGSLDVPTTSGGAPYHLEFHAPIVVEGPDKVPPPCCVQ
jgi:hypothetical protein